MWPWYRWRSLSSHLARRSALSWPAASYWIRVRSCGLREDRLRLMQRHRRDGRAGGLLFRKATGDPFLQPGSLLLTLALLFRLALGEAALLAGEGRRGGGGAEEGEQVRGVAAVGQVEGFV